MHSLHEPHALPDPVTKLLNTLEVRLHACTLCSVSSGTHATFDPVDAITIHYVLSGHGALRAGDGRVRLFGPKSVIIVPARANQTWAGGTNFANLALARPQCGPVHDEWSRLPPDLNDSNVLVVRSEITVTNAGVPGFFDHLREPILVAALPEDHDEQQTFRLLLKELARPGLGSTAVAEGFMKVLLVLLLRRHLPSSDEFTSSFTMMSDPRLARAMVQILERPADTHTVDTLAAAAGMSRTAFIERFRKIFSQSPIEFLQGFRLKFAAHLLMTTNLPIKSVAVAVGYSSRSYFSRIFSASYNADPTAYRVEFLSRPKRRNG